MGTYFSTSANVIDETGAAVLLGPDDLRKKFRLDRGVSQARLETAVETAVTTGRGSLMIWRAEDEGLGLLVRIRAAREEGRAVVSFQDLDDPFTTLEPKLVADLLGLCRSEAEVAIDLFHGLEVNDIASRRRVQVETVRTQIKNLLRKSGLPNQKRLVCLLAKVAVLAAA